MQIDWLTVIAQIVNFLILVWLLKRFLYQPVIGAMARREERIAARLAEAAQREDEAESRASEYREKSDALERTWNGKLDEARAAAEQERLRLLDQARREIDEQREKWLRELEREQEASRKMFKRELAAMAVAIARRALLDLADTALESRVADVFLDRLESSPEKRGLFSHGTGPVLVSSSFELDAEMRRRLRSALDAPVDVEFARDGDLTCGIVLSGAGYKLEWDIMHYLGDFERRLDELFGMSVAERRGHA